MSEATKWELRARRAEEELVEAKRRVEAMRKAYENYQQFATEALKAWKDIAVTLFKALAMNMEDDPQPETEDEDLEVKPNIEQALRESLVIPHEALLTAEEMRTKLDSQQSNTVCPDCKKDGLYRECPFCGWSAEGSNTLIPVEETDNATD